MSRRVGPGEQRLQPGSPFHVVAPERPEPGARHAQAQSGFEIAAIRQPVQGGEQVGVLSIQEIEPRPLPGVNPLEFRLFGEGEKMGSVCIPRRGLLAAALQTLEGVLANRLQHREAGRCGRTGVEPEQQAHADQRLDQREDFVMAFTPIRE
jgi:hypothetical protein